MTDRVSEKVAFLRRQAESVRRIGANPALADSLARDYERRAAELELEAKEWPFQGERVTRCTTST